MGKKKLWLACAFVLSFVFMGFMGRGAGESTATGATVSGSASVVSGGAISGLRQSDAGVVSGECFIKLEWNGLAPRYKVEQLSADGVWTPLGVCSGSSVTVRGGFSAGQSLSFRVYGLDGKDTGAVIENVRTVPAKQSTPSLLHWYLASDEADFSWMPDPAADGYQVRVEKANGKKLRKKAVSDSAVSMVALTPSYRGRVVRLKVRGFIRLNGKKKFGEWSDYFYYASAKKLKLSGYKDAITVSGLKVKDAAKKEIYISKKKKSGFVKAKTVKGKKSSVKVYTFGKNRIQSDKIYYVRVNYYYDVDGKLEKSPISDEGKVYVEPTYFYVT